MAYDGLIAGHTILGNESGSRAEPAPLTGAQATTILSDFAGDSGSGGTKGLVPAPGAGDAAAGKFLKADGTFAVPAGGGNVSATGSPASGNLTKFSGATSVTDGDLSGDVTTSGALATTLANTAVSAGSYVLASFTVDAKGRLTAASNGTNLI